MIVIVVLMILAVIIITMEVLRYMKLISIQVYMKQLQIYTN
ncbi:MAG: hypothetical protein RR054_00985 [Clostridia bacterium]